MKFEFITQNKPPGDTQQLLTAVFIDYESLYLSFIGQFKIPPDLNRIFDNVKKTGRIYKIKVFGDFTKNELSRERDRIRTITSDIIDCSPISYGYKKDYTDFIMLDHMYQEIIQNPSTEQFILFTGDGHFSSAATFLKTFMDKTVGVYGVKGTLSRHLMECCSWSKIMDVLDDDDEVYQMNLIRNLKRATDRGILITFMKTVEHTAKNYGGDETKYEWILRKLIDDDYIASEMCTAFSDREFKILVPNWDKIEDELLNPSLIPPDRRMIKGM